MKQKLNRNGIVVRHTEHGVHIEARGADALALLRRMAGLREDPDAFAAEAPQDAATDVTTQEDEQ